MNKPIILTSNILISLLTFGTSVTAITLYPFILFRNKKERDDKFILNHETIYFTQQKELGSIKFYYMYLEEYFKLKKYYKRNSYWDYDYMAYYNISFEKEAYTNEKKLNYLDTREKFSFNKYKSKFI